MDDITKVNDMTARYLDPTNDMAFHRVFSDHARMKSFVNVILRLPDGSRISDLEFIPPAELPDFLGIGKRAPFALKVKDEADKCYIVEVQNRKEDSVLKGQKFSTTSSNLNQARRGAAHDGLMPVILVAIVNNQIFPDDVECISYHHTLDVKTKQRLLFDVSYVFVELAKFHKKEDEIKTLEDAWLYFLACQHEAKSPPVNIKDRTILEAFENVEQLNWTEGQYDAYIRAKLAADAEEITRKAVFSRDEAKGKIEVAKAMLDRVLGAEDVAELTELTQEQIKELQGENK